MQEVVRRNGVLHDTEIGRTFQKMLALTTGIFGAHLLAVDALYREALEIHVSVMNMRRNTGVGHHLYQEKAGRGFPRDNLLYLLP